MINKGAASIDQEDILLYNITHFERSPKNFTFVY